MLLAVDVGNTEITIGVFQGEELAQHWRASTVAERTADEHALLLDGFLAQQGLGLRRLGGGLLGAAAAHPGPARDGPAVLPGRAAGDRARRPHRLPILTDNLREVGADRVVNAIAAYAAYGGPVVVVDFGTATTFDAVSERGEHLRGHVFGIQISMNALVERTAQLRRVELVEPRSVIGKNTVESLQAGAIWGFAGQVDGIVRRMVAELGGEATVVATGGLAGAMLEACETVQRHEPWLTLYGLRIIWTGTTPMSDRRQRQGLVEGRALSPRAFRPFGIEAVVLGPPTTQEGWSGARAWPCGGAWLSTGRCSTGWPRRPRSTPTGCCRCGVVVAATPARDWTMRVPALGERAARVEAAAEPPPAAGWLLLVDEGPGETWLYLAEETTRPPSSTASSAAAPHRLRPGPSPLRRRQPGQLRLVLGCSR